MMMIYVKFWPRLGEFYVVQPHDDWNIDARPGEGPRPRPPSAALLHAAKFLTRVKGRKFQQQHQEIGSRKIPRRK